MPTVSGAQVVSARDLTSPVSATYIDRARVARADVRAADIAIGRCRADVGVALVVGAVIVAIATYAATGICVTTVSLAVVYRACTSARVERALVRVTPVSCVAQVVRTRLNGATIVRIAVIGLTLVRFVANVFCTCVEGITAILSVAPV